MKRISKSVFAGVTAFAAVAGLAGYTAYPFGMKTAAAAEDKESSIKLGEFGVGPAKVAAELKKSGEKGLCLEGKLTTTVGGEDFEAELAGGDICGKKVDGGILITAEAKAGEINVGKKVSAAEAEVILLVKGAAIAKGKAKLVVANTTKDPERAYFIYDGKEMKKTDKKTYEELKLEG